MNSLDELKVIEALNQLRERKTRAGSSEYSDSPTLSNYGTPPPGVGTSAANSNNKLPSSSSTITSSVNGITPPNTTNHNIPLTVASTIPRQAPLTRHGAPHPPFSTQPKAWKNMLITATSLVLTRDARKKLRQLLTVLRLATDHLHEKIGVLKTAMDKDATNDNVTPVMSTEALRNDILTTIKRSLAMISTMATNSLPGNVRNKVRRMILKLPSKWALLLEKDDGSRPSESAILALATETLLSIGNITIILSETLERADLWVEKLPKINLTKRGKLNSKDLSEQVSPKLENVQVSEVEIEQKQKLDNNKQLGTEPRNLNETETESENEHENK